MTQEQPKLANDVAQPLALVLHYGGLPGPDEQVVMHRSWRASLDEQVHDVPIMVYRLRCTGPRRTGH